MRDTYCPYPFIGASLQSNGSVFPCGQYMNEAPLMGIIPIEDIRNNSHMQEMRRKMLNGERDSGCQCPAEEAVGLPSMRQAGVRQYGRCEFGPLKTVELFFDNVCNLKCRMCSSSSTHLMYEEEKLMYGITIADSKYIKNSRYKDLNVSALEEIKVYGGEPLLSKEVDDFFKRLLAETDVENLMIEVSTNGTVLPMPNVMEVFRRCKRLKLNISIDAYGELNDFIRSGSDFNSIVDNLKFYHDHLVNVDNWLVVIHSAISVYNVNLITDLDKFIKENFPRFVSLNQLVQFPVYLNIQNLPEDYKKMIPTEGLSTGIVDHLNLPSEAYFDHFVNFHNQMNSIRGESLEKVNPLLHKYVSTYQTTIKDSREFFVDRIKELKGL